jgi:hypothetical protein
MSDANNCYKILNIDIPPLKGSFDDVDPRKFYKEGRIGNKFSTSLFINPDLINFLANNNITLNEYSYASNGIYHTHQSGPTYEAFTDGNYSDAIKNVASTKWCTIEWDFSEIKPPIIFLDTANSSNTYDPVLNHTVFNNCDTIINTFTPDNRPFLINCQIPSVENQTQEQTDQKIRNKKISLVFAGNTFANVVNKLSSYII